MLRAMADAPDIEPVLRVGEALALLADPVLDRHLDVVEGDLPRPVIDDELLRPQQFHAGRFHVDDEGRDAATRALGAVGCGNELRVMRLVGVADEALGAVDDVVIALAHRGGAHAARIAAGFRLGLGQAPVQLAADRRQQVLFLLLVVEVIEDRADIGAEHVGAARRQRDAAAKLGPDRRFGDQPHAEAAIFHRHVVALQAQLLGLGGQMLPDLRLELVVLARRALDQDQLAVDELADGVLEHPDFLRKIEVQSVGRGARVHVDTPILCALILCAARRERRRRARRRLWPEQSAD